MDPVRRRRHRHRRRRATYLTRATPRRNLVFMKSNRSAVVAFVFALTTLFAALPAFAQADQDPKPIKALMITGGPYHDYGKQKVALADGLARRANIQWTIYHE